MQRKIWLVGAMMASALSACGSSEPAPGSAVAKASGGSGGTGGAAGSLSLDISGGSGGLAGGGGSGGGGTGGSPSAGSPTGGTASVAGSSGAGGSGGAKVEGTCKRAPGSDASCTEFVEAPSQAYACDDRPSYSKLNGTHGNQCINVSGVVPGATVGACCPP